MERNEGEEEEEERIQKGNERRKRKKMEEKREEREGERMRESFPTSIDIVNQKRKSRENGNDEDDVSNEWKK